jgi:hypothetical protein
METGFSVWFIPKLYKKNRVSVEWVTESERVVWSIRELAVAVSKQNEQQKISTWSYHSKLHIVNSQPSHLWWNHCGWSLWRSSALWFLYIINCYKNISGKPYDGLCIHTRITEDLVKRDWISEAGKWKYHATKSWCQCCHGMCVCGVLTVIACLVGEISSPPPPSLEAQPTSTKSVSQFLMQRVQLWTTRLKMFQWYFSRSWQSSMGPSQKKTD